MTDYEREIEVKVLTMRDLAKTTNSEQATEALTKLASSYNKSVLADMLEYYNISAPLNAAKPILVNMLVRTIVTEAVITKSWQRWFFKMMVVMGAW